MDIQKIERGLESTTVHKNKVSISIISDEKEILRSAASSPVVNTALLLNMTTSEHQSNKVKKYSG